MMGQEFLKQDKIIYFATACFVFDGLVAVFCAFVFFWTKSQTVYISFIAVVVLILWVIFVLYCPDTPKFLYEKGKYLEL
jgi:uncharacterized membrane protein